MRHNKKTEEGFRERLALLAGRYAEAERVLDSILTQEEKQRVARDDAVDALAAALTGVGSGALQTLPETPERDAAGIPREMVFAG